MDIIARHEWGAQYGVGTEDPGAEANVVMHHSFKPALLSTATLLEEIAAWQGIERFHVQENKWDGIGYNFGVAPSGRIFEGRGWKFRGAHAGPINSDSIGICLLINGNAQDPTKEMVLAVRELIRLGIDIKEIATTYKISGHRDHMARACPGDIVYNQIQRFRHNYVDPEDMVIDDTVIKLVSSVEKVPAPFPQVVIPLLTSGASARYVVSRYAGGEEPASGFLERMLDALMNDPLVKKRLGWAHPFVLWGVKRLVKVLQ